MAQKREKKKERWGRKLIPHQLIIASVENEMLEPDLSNCQCTSHTYKMVYLNATQLYCVCMDRLMQTQVSLQEFKIRLYKCENKRQER